MQNAEGRGAIEFNMDARQVLVGALALAEHPWAQESMPEATAKEGSKKS